ncbi:MAG TPA: TMEM208 family protein [Anaerolineae bacterium]|nr:TMEM208 family protein [Anaerolineae bacterium]
MKIINRYSFGLMAAVVFLVIVIFTLRGGLNGRHLIVLGALSLGIVLAYRFLNPDSSSPVDSDRILAEIHSGSPVLLEFQSPY